MMADLFVLSTDWNQCRMNYRIWWYYNCGGGSCGGGGGVTKCGGGSTK